MDIFKRKNIKPMLIGETKEAFDSPDYIYELKLDGERCIAYLDEEGTELRNKRNLKMLPKVPELSDIHKQVNCRCILDGELIILKMVNRIFSKYNGVPSPPTPLKFNWLQPNSQPLLPLLMFCIIKIRQQ